MSYGTKEWLKCHQGEIILCWLLETCMCHATRFVVIGTMVKILCVCSPTPDNILVLHAAIGVAHYWVCTNVMRIQVACKKGQALLCSCLRLCAGRLHKGPYLSRHMYSIKNQFDNQFALQVGGARGRGWHAPALAAVARRPEGFRRGGLCAMGWAGLQPPGRAGRRSLEAGLAALACA